MDKFKLFCNLIIGLIIFVVMVRIPIAWDHNEPGTVDYYQIQIDNKLYGQTTKLPTDANPFYLSLPVITGSRIINFKVRAFNSSGFSLWSNEKEIEMKFIVKDVEVTGT